MMTATTVPPCHLCGGILQPIRNRHTKKLSAMLACEHCDQPHEFGSCRTCSRIFKTARLFGKD